MGAVVQRDGQHEEHPLGHRVPHNCKDFQFPELVKHRGVYSFRSGVYLCREDAFRPAADVPDSVVACKFFDTELELDFDRDWRDIPTPHLQSIMDYQEFPPEVCDWLYVLLGRLLYQLNDLDGWQIIPFMKGVGASGKCHCLGSPLLLYDGTSRAVEDIGVGELLMGDDGSPRRVLALARGVDELYTLVPRRKGYEPLTVTGEHVLCLKYSNQGCVARWKYGKVVQYFCGTEHKAKKKKFTDMAAMEAFCAELDREEVFEMTVHEYSRLPEYLRKYLVCYRVAVDFAVTEEPLFDPWALGVWLGDGNSANAGITNDDEDVVAALRDAVQGWGCELRDLANRFRYSVRGSSAGAGAVAKKRSTNPFLAVSAAPGGPGAEAPGASAETSRAYPTRRTFLQALRAYGVLGNKHVPHALKTGSRATRLDVLAGLLDTDGWKNPAGYYEITQKREALADDVVFLARSLGFGATKRQVSKAAVKPDGSRAWGTYFRVNVFGEGLHDIPLRCARKRFAAGELKPVKDARRWGFDVVPAGVQPYFGFQTDGNQRYVLGDFTVTHNSTILLKVAKNFYESVDVGVLSNNIEKTFGISAFHDKYAFVAPELRNDLRMDQSEFQSIVSGEDIQVNVKHQKAFATQWTVPGLLAGNEVPSWVDSSGSIQRRLVVFDFARTVVNGDMKLGEKLDAEAPLILVKCNRAYRQAAAAHGQKNIWTVLPAYFRSTRDETAQAVNSVEAFLASAECRVSHDAYVPFDDFKAALKAFEQHNAFKPTKYTWDFFRGPFAKYNITKARARKDYRGRTLHREYLFGVDLVDQDAECALG